MPTSNRVLSGSLTKGSKATGVGLDEISGSIDAHRQGVHVRNMNDLLNFTSYKLRSNSSFRNTFRGRDLPENIFDDSLAATNVSGVQTASSTALTSGSAAQISIGGDGRLGQRLTHVMEVRDLGQSAYYDDDFFVDMQKPTGEYVVNTHPVLIELPNHLVDHSSLSSFDGVIEPLDIRKVIDHSSTEMPYVARSVKASLGAGEDKFKHSNVITDSISMEEVRNPQTVYFLDSVEHMGIVDIPGIQNVNTVNIAAFKDTVDQEATLDALNDAGMKAVLMKANYTDDDAMIPETSLNAARGFVFQNSVTGYDSIAYGGLKK